MTVGVIQSVGVGVVVHYSAPRARCIAALVTDVREVGGYELEVKLTLFPADGAPVPVGGFWIPRSRGDDTASGWHHCYVCRR